MIYLHDLLLPESYCKCISHKHDIFDKQRNGKTDIVFGSPDAEDAGPLSGDMIPVDAVTAVSDRKMKKFVPAMRACAIRWRRL